MKFIQNVVAALAAAGIVVLFLQPCHAVSLNYVGTQRDIGGTFYPSGVPPCCIVPWRSNSTNNTFAVSPNEYYGTAGYGLFATQFEYPPFNAGYSGPVTDEPFSTYFTDILELPDFVTDSLILSARKAGGWSYALIDDPRLQAGPRYWTFDGVNYPPPDGTNTTGGIPYVKLGILNGNDVFGNNPGTAPAARWGFEVGNDVPQKFRLGVMTGGLDNSTNVPNEVFLSQIVDEMPTTTVSTGVLVDPAENNRFVDMHFFDITGAQPGDEFVISATKDPASIFTAGISGFSFDIVPVAAIDGDFNEDGTVDAADYVIWRKNGGTQQEYDAWRAHFGESLGSGSSSGAGAVPEPTAGLMWTIAVCALAIRSRRRARE